MQEKVEKYIYKINDNRYRIKFLKVSKAENLRIKFDEYFNGSLEEAIEYRDEQLEKLDIPLEETKKRDNIFDTNYDEDIKTKKQSKKKESSTTGNKVKESKNETKVDKYIYEITKGKRYRVFIRKGGSNGQKGDYYSTYIDGTLAQARKVRDKKLAEFKLKTTDVSKGNTKFIEFVKIYYSEYAERELSPTTVTGGKMGLRNYILPEIANTPLNKIDALTVQKILNKLKDQNKQRLNEDGQIEKLSSATVNTVYRLLRKILNKAVEWDYLEKNPVLKVKAPEISKKEKSTYNKEQLKEILNLLKKEDITTQTMFNIFICTGIRRGELAGLHVDDIDFNESLIRVRRGVVWDNEKKILIEKEPKTKGSIRDVPVPSFCLDLIREYLIQRDKLIEKYNQKFGKDYSPPDNLFLGVNGTIIFPDTLSSKWVSFRKKHSHLKKVSLHGLRHTYCSLQMNDNPELAASDVQKLMGHSQLDTTFGYTHSTEEKKEQAVHIFEMFCNNEEKRKFNFRQVLSVCTGKNYTTTVEINEILNFLNDSCKKEENEMYINAKKVIYREYPMLKELNDYGVNLNNVWDWMELQIEKYGNVFYLGAFGMEYDDNEDLDGVLRL